MVCEQILTYVYSSHCVEYLEALIESIQSTFSIKASLDDMFYYGLFCNAETYSNFEKYEGFDGDVPDILTNQCQSPDSKLKYVKGIIENIIKGEVEKPEWMIYVEETETFNCYSDAPSTFLYLVAKDEKYEVFGEALTNFLYSPNLMMTLKNQSS